MGIVGFGPSAEDIMVFNLNIPVTMEPTRSKFVNVTKSKTNYGGTHADFYSIFNFELRA